MLIFGCAFWKHILQTTGLPSPVDFPVCLTSQSFDFPVLWLPSLFDFPVLWLPSLFDFPVLWLPSPLASQPVWLPSPLTSQSFGFPACLTFQSFGFPACLTSQSVWLLRQVWRLRAYKTEKTLGAAKPLWYLSSSLELAKDTVQRIVWMMLRHLNHVCGFGKSVAQSALWISFWSALTASVLKLPGLPSLHQPGTLRSKAFMQLTQSAVTLYQPLIW